MKFLLLLLLTITAAISADPFILVIKTNNPGESGSKAFTLPLAAGASYDFTVDWGDGTSEVVTTSTSPTHVYATRGTYSVAITENVLSGFPQIYFHGGGDAQKVLAIAQWGDVTWTSMSVAFEGCSNMTITATDAATAKTGDVTDFSGAWYQCSSLTSFPLLDTSAGTNFGGAWGLCSGLTTFPLLDTSSGTTFSGAWVQCTSLTSFPLLDTSSCTDVSYAWMYCSGLTSFPILDSSSVTDFSSAWYHCTGLTSFPLLDTSAGLMFFETWSGCTALTSFPLLNTAAGRNFREAWYNCTALTTFPTLDLRHMEDGGDCFVNVTLTSDSYTDLLLSLAANNTYMEITFNGGHSQYHSSASNARNTILITNRSWTITDGGLRLPEITSATNVAALTNAAFSYQITASNDPTSYTASPLPVGLAINGATGEITGTTPASIGIHSITLTATNAEGTGDATLTLCVNEPGAPVITSATSAGGVVGKSFRYTITATGNPTSFNATGLPAGLSINTSTGRISGTPTTDDVSNVTLAASNANGTGPATLTLTIATTGGGGDEDSDHRCGVGNGIGAATLLILCLFRIQCLVPRRRRPASGV